MNGSRQTMERKHISSHTMTARHLRHKLKYFSGPQNHKPATLLSISLEVHATDDPILKRLSGGLLPIHDTALPLPIDDAVPPINDPMLSPDDTLPPTDDTPMPLSQLWGLNFGERTFEMAQDSVDYFEESHHSLSDQTARLFSMSRSQDEMGIEVDGEDNGRADTDNEGENDTDLDGADGTKSSSSDATYSTASPRRETTPIS
jgi:hypothetical protein